MLQRIISPILAVILVNSSMAVAQTDCEVTVHVDQPTVVLPETLYGLFYEDINHAGDGGLYAELVQNRSFEYYPVTGWNPASKQMTPLYAWEKVERGGAVCSLSVENSAPLNQRNTNYVRLHTEQSGDGVGLANTGFSGIPVKSGETYDFSFYARRSHSQDSPVVVSIEGASGDLGRAVIDRLSGQWQKHEASITVRGTDEKTRLVLTTRGEGDVFMDMISLFPRRTFQNRKNGLRADLVEALIDLKPAVFRFPGGCITHGHGLENAYRWKDTVGDVATRKPNWNLWGYHQSYGLGYFEFFQLCEDLGAEPLPVVPLGVSCGFRQPFQHEQMDRLPAWVDDAVDLIEFANGPASTKWGGVRAEMGHPEPFGLKYIALGNEEHHTPEFEQRFPYFVQAIRHKAPDIKIVGTSGLGYQIPIYDFMDAQGVDLSDEHYYEPPEWFISHQHRFDQFDRSKPRIFVGEYASRGNSLYHAVAEACYLTGIERNADIVVMTAYAPLFARYHYTQWGAANLIWFDQTRVVRTPNYYVQQLFSLHKGDRVLRTDSRFPRTPGPGTEPARGQIGVGTWLTTAEFDDIQVRAGDRVLIQENFATGTEEWHAAAGSYATNAGTLAQSDLACSPAMMLCQTKIDAPSATVTLRAKKTGGREGFLILFGSQEEKRYYWWNIGGWGNSRHAIELGSDGLAAPRAEIATRRGSIQSQVWYDIRIELTGDRIRGFLNDELIHDVTLPQPELGVVASRQDSSGDTILKIANPTLDSYPTRVNLRGIPSVNPTGTLTLLTGDKSDVNDLEHPDRIKPITREIRVGTSFDYTVPPMSVQFLRIHSP